VRRLHAGAAAGVPLSLGWDGRDAAGGAAASGVYFLRAKAGDEASSRRIALRR
jgi:hypothetical protein